MGLEGDCHNHPLEDTPLHKADIGHHIDLDISRHIVPDIDYHIDSDINHHIVQDTDCLQGNYFNNMDHPSIIHLLECEHMCCLRIKAVTYFGLQYIEVIKTHSTIPFATQANYFIHLLSLMPYYCMSTH